MCVIAQLPRVLLMTTTLWQGVVTVLSMCVFRSLEGGQRIDWAESRYSLRSAPRSAMWANLPFGLWHPNGAYGLLQTFGAAIYATFFVPSQGRLTMAQYFRHFGL